MSVMAITEQIPPTEQLLRTPGQGRCELLCGELIMMAPAGFEHGNDSDSNPHPATEPTGPAPSCQNPTGDRHLVASRGDLGVL